MNNKIRRTRIAENLLLGAVTAGNAETLPHRNSPITLLSLLLDLEVTRGRVAPRLLSLVQTLGRERTIAKRVNNVASIRAVEVKERQTTVRGSQLLAKAIVNPMVNQRTSQRLPLPPLSRAMLCPRYSVSSPI
jgi:hypothetical protein